MQLGKSGEIDPESEAPEPKQKQRPVVAVTGDGSTSSKAAESNTS